MLLQLPFRILDLSSGEISGICDGGSPTTKLVLYLSHGLPEMKSNCPKLRHMPTPRQKAQSPFSSHQPNPATTVDKGLRGPSGGSWAGGKAWTRPEKSLVMDWVACKLALALLNLLE